MFRSRSAQEPITIYNCTPGSISTFVLLVDGKVIQQGVIKPTGACRMIHLLNVGNVRDLGGWDCDGGRVKYGLLFRGGEMYGYLTDDGDNRRLICSESSRKLTCVLRLN